MATELFANNFTTTLTATISSGQTSVVLASPVPSGLRMAGQWRLQIDSELLLVTAVAGDFVTCTVTRGSEGTTAAAHNAGAPCTHILTAGAITNLTAGAGGSISAGAYLGRPSAGSAGRLYVCSDIPVQFLDNGTTWDAQVKGQFVASATIPTQSGWTWNNQQATTWATTKAGLWIQGDTTYHGLNAVAWPWAVNKTLLALACFTPQNRGNHNGWLGGIYLGNTTAPGAAYCLGMYNLPPPNITGAYFSTITGGWANNLNNNDATVWPVGDYVWIKCWDSAGFFNMATSRNGFDWELIYNVGDTFGNAWGTGVTPNQIGVGVAQVNCHLLSWQVF